uniref:BTB domain-containing protein n=1 Tax=Arcella intermedia TaxID=1963864 RepID=A0A6B2L3L1_9EUKA
MLITVNHKEQHCERLKTFVNNPDLSDVTFIIEGKPIHAHRTLLALASPYFRALFTNSMRETTSPQVALEGPSRAGFLAVLEYLYAGSVGVDAGNVMELMDLSRMYQLEGLRGRCVEFVGDAVDPHSAVGLFAACFGLGEEEVKGKCLELICKDPGAAFGDEKQLGLLDAEKWKVLLERDQLEMDELKLFELVHCWFTKFSKKGVEDKEVFKWIRYGVIPARDLIKTVKPTGCAPSELYYLALEYQAASDLFKELNESQAKLFKKRINTAIDSIIPFKNVGDNGIIYYCGTNGGKETWKNPCKSGLITVKGVSLNGELGCFVENKSTTGHIGSNNQPNSFLCLQFQKIRVRPNYYCIWPHNSDTSYYARNWNFEGSNDDVKWTVIREHKNDGSFQSPKTPIAWPLECNNFFSYFRVISTGPNKSGSHYYLTFSALEIYGSIQTLN